MSARGRLILVVVALACFGAASSSAAAAQRVVWLCKPGQKANPCAVGSETTRFSPTGARFGVDDVNAPRRPRFDCFYVYPTVSDQPTPTANFEIDPELRSIALYQAARFTSECRMYAPVYRQVTLAALNGAVTATPAERARAFRDVRAAWRRYLSEAGHGRGVVLVGHSQGAFMLRELVEEEIDRRPAVRRRLISALLLGGNVLVRKGSDAGGDFRNVKACRSRRQVGCVVAFSTFNAPVPADAAFGRTTAPGLEVLCTNPAALAGGSGKLTPVYPRRPFAPNTTIGLATRLVGSPTPRASTPWLAFPGSYRASCSLAGGAHVLEIAALGGAPTLRPVPDARWGLHLTDANIALGNLTELVRAQGTAWLKLSRLR